MDLDRSFIPGVKNLLRIGEKPALFNVFAILRTLLADLGPMVEREAVQSPAIIVVGEVVQLADAQDKLARWAQTAEALA